MTDQSDNHDAPLVEAMAREFINAIVAMPRDQGDWPPPLWKDLPAARQAEFRIAMVSALAALRKVRHDDRSIPCPCCGFCVRQVKRQSFLYEDLP